MSVPRFSMKRFLLAKTETTEQTDSTPDNTNGIYAESLTVTPLDAQVIDRNTIKPYMGASAKITASFSGKLEVEVAAAVGGDSEGAPSPGTTPQWDALMKACGMTRTTSGSAITGTAQGGTTGTIQLASGASATDDAYTGLSIAATVISGTAQAPGSSEKNIIKLASSGSSASDDYYNGLKIRVKHFAGTIVSTGQTISNKNRVYLDTAVSTNDVVDTFIEITTGSVVERRRITAYNTANKRATLNKPLGTTPTDSSTYVIYQDRLVGDYNGTSKVVTLTRTLKFVTTTDTDYVITCAPRQIIAYDGTNKIATVAQAFETAPTSSTTYVINPYVKYGKTSSNHSSVTLYYYEDGALHTFVGARGNAVLDFSNGKLPTIKFTLTGLVDRYEDASFPTFNNSAFVEPLPVNKENTKDLIIHGYANTVMESLSIDMGNDVQYLNRPGYEGVRIMDHAVKGSLSIWSPLQSEMDFYAIAQNNDMGVLAFTHGPVGNQVAVVCQNTQLLSPKADSGDKIVKFSCDLNMVATGTGSNELYIVLQ